ncbi:3224_t:CDS:2 [Funneliformis geosporum]|uniref:1278_t:CDS:1 n=1 Tax=Funneliformis geosporum TaxID=1117311 RepID=A0A9W4X138_9GLOM|nr:1278_t:CDS:2 [Funneliformis geosporum]CAI2187807.1 3224_t:CDS:2 [Funneliformis geosporum]
MQTNPFDQNFSIFDKKFVPVISDRFLDMEPLEDLLNAKYSANQNKSPWLKKPRLKALHLTSDEDIIEMDEIDEIINIYSSFHISGKFSGQERIQLFEYRRR